MKSRNRSRIIPAGRRPHPAHPSHAPVRQLAIIRETLDQMMGASSLDDLFNRSVSTLHRLLQNDATVLLELADDQHTLLVRAVETDWQISEKAIWSVDRGMIGMAARSQQTQVAQDVTRDPHYIQYRDWPAQAELCVPIVIRQGLWGVLDLQSVRQAAYPAYAVEVAITVARQLAMAIENAELIKHAEEQALQLRRQKRELTQVLALNSQLRVEMNLDQMLQHLADSVAVVVGFRTVTVYLADPTQDRVWMAALSQTAGPSHEPHQPTHLSWSYLFGYDSEHFRLSRSFFFPADVGHPLSYLSHRPEHTISQPTFWQPGDVLLVPIVNTRGEALGVVAVDDPDDRQRPSLATIQGLEIFATQAAALIENQRLFARTQDALTAVQSAHERQTQLLDEVRRTQAELVTASKLAAVGTLAAGVAHEFNNLLAAMQGYAELGLIDALENKNEALDTVIRTCQRGAHITRRLLTLARQGEGSREVVKLDEVAEGAIQLINWDLARHNIDIRRDYRATCLTLGDPGQLMQVVLNLLTNARDAVFEFGGTIIVAIEDRDDWVELSVIDDGPGIADHVRERLFEPFFTTKGALGGGTLGGTGLGLAVSYAIIQAHHGRLLADNLPQKGCCFTIRLPRYVGEIPRAMGDMPTPYVPSQRILLVDPNTDVRVPLAGLLTRFGHVVGQALDGAEALQKATIQRWDVILADLTLREYNGLELFHALRSQGIQTPMILMVGQFDSSLNISAHHPQPNAILAKPFDMDQILRAIAVAIADQLSINGIGYRG